MYIICCSQSSQVKNRNEENLPVVADNNASFLPISATHILPSRVITIFGLEGSGTCRTTFLSQALASAVGASAIVSNFTWKNAHMEIQHVSQQVENRPQRNVIVTATCSADPYTMEESPLVLTNVVSSNIQYIIRDACL